MLMGDFLSLVQLGLPVKVVVFNNGALGFIELEQKSTGFLPFGTEFKNPNFAAMAEAVGVRGIRLEDPAEVDDGIAAALAHDGPVLVDAVVNRTELAMPPAVTDGDGEGLHALHGEGGDERPRRRADRPRPNESVALMREVSPTERCTIMSDEPAVPSSPALGPDDEKPVFAPYNPPAGGWGALRATARALREQSVEIRGTRALLSMNQPDGFDCPGCAWPDPRHASSFDFCENGAKAVTWELTKHRVTREFFAAHTIRELEQESDYWLEQQGRLTEPMRYDPATDHYVPVGWDEAFALVARELNALDDPNEAEFYTSGRTSNEGAFMYQLFARRFGTNNFPDCSNMCHEPTSVGLPESIGIGKGTVLLDDFAYSDAIFIIGQQPGTNSPRMLTELHNASRRGVPIVVFNPLRERALERFAAPQDPLEMATFGETRIASEYCQVRIGGDVAALKGVMKLVLEAHDTALRDGREPILDVEFIAQHTHGFEAFADDLHRTAWENILSASGLPRDQLERVANIYMRASAVIVCYGMGITQHRLGTANVQQTANLLLLRGNFGKPGAGICPVRGHSNVQGDRTMGVDENPKPEFLDQIKKVFGFEPPRARGHRVVDAVQAMVDGPAKVFIGCGGNFVRAVPDWPAAEAAMRRLRADRCG